MTTPAHTHGRSGSTISFAPVSLVPDDVLHEIFLLLAASARLIENESLRDDTSWLAISHVCRYWRSFALASPQLWTFIIVDEDSSTAMIREFLKRSKDSLLHITIVGRSGRHNAEGLLRTVQALSVHAHRFVTFHASHLQPLEMTAVLAHISSPAPVLQTLYLEALTSPPVVRGHVFNGQMPSLREISITGIAAPWLPYKNLTKLALLHQSIPSIEDLLWTLRNCPKLEFLNLGLLGSMAQGSLSDQLTIIDLPHLTELTLSCGRDDALHLMTQLSFPTTAKIDIRLHGPCRFPIKIAQNCPSLGQIASGVESALLHMSHNITGYRVSMVSEFLAFAVEQSWNEVEAGVGGEAGLILEEITFPALRELTIQNRAYGAAEEEWLHIFTLMPSLVSMVVDVRYGSPLNLLRALGQVVVAPSGGMQTASVVCPNLKSLILSGLDGATDYLLEQIVASLGTRTCRGARLGSFEITLTSPTTYPHSLIAQLTDIAEKVTVHGQDGA